MAKQLGIRSGNLIRSFGRNSEFSLFEVKQSDGKFEITLGSKLPYAAIQNYGGFIKATPTTLSNGRKSYKMSRYFWARYMKSQNEKFKYMALSVEKRGGVQIKPTFYFDKAIKFLDKQILPKEYEKVINNLIMNSNKVSIEKLSFVFINSIQNLAFKFPDLFLIALSRVMKDRGEDSVND